VTGRPLHALLLPPAEGAGRLLGALAAALDGTGPAILPLDPGLPPAQLRALLDAFAPTVIETPQDTQRWHPSPHRPPPSAGAAAGQQPAAAGAGRDPAAGQPPGASHPARPAVPGDVAVVIATSGSTGEPKGVQLSAAALLHSARASLERIGARPSERWLCALPTSHISGLGVLVRSVVTGLPPLVLDRLDPGGQDLAALGCSYVSLVPTQLRRLLAAGADLTGFGAILLGGAAAPAGLLAAARAAGARVITTYGMSETSGGCVYDGVPLAGVSVRTGAGGRIQISGPVVFSGYRGRDDLTAATMDGDWFVTADVGATDDAGRLVFHGRADEMINTGGEKVAPAAVSAVLEECPGVREAVVLGVPDPEWGERVTAVVVPADPAAPPRLPDLRAVVRARMPAFAAPRALVCVPAIPLLPSGKPDLTALHALGREAWQDSEAGQVPTNPA
jgi:o-succinylbenzoate---CoA ligase